MQVFRTALCAAVLLIAAGAAPAGTPVEHKAGASPHPFLGTWEITRHQVAPWVTQPEERNELAADGASRLNLKIVFAKDEVIAKDPILGCTDAHYEPTSYPPQAVFQGALPEPDQEKIALGLGLPASDIPGFDLDCSTGLFSYHFANADTALVALSDVIFWLTREK